jgi:hypothetical protein
MTAPVSLRQVAHLRLALPSHHKWVAGLGWIPVSPTELHLTSRFFPVTIRLTGSRPSLGLLLDERYLARPLVDQAGMWQGTYMPIALRCFPFEAPALDKDPLEDLKISPDCEYLVATGGHALVEQSGQPSTMVSEVHRLLRLMREGQEILATAIDRLLIGDLLVALTLPESDGAPASEAPYYTIDRARFLQLDNKALAAMARQNFLSVDVAAACMFSQQILKRDCLAKPAAAEAAKTQGRAAPPPLLDLVGIADFSLALDDGDLISLDDIYAMRSGFSVPAETAPEEEDAEAAAPSAARAPFPPERPIIAPERDVSDSVPDIGQLLREAAARLGREAPSRFAPPRQPPLEIAQESQPGQPYPPARPVMRREGLAGAARPDQGPAEPRVAPQERAPQRDQQAHESPPLVAQRPSERVARRDERPSRPPFGEPRPSIGTAPPPRHAPGPGPLERPETAPGGRPSLSERPPLREPGAPPRPPVAAEPPYDAPSRAPQDRTSPDVQPPRASPRTSERVARIEGAPAARPVSAGHAPSLPQRPVERRPSSEHLPPRRPVPAGPAPSDMRAVRAADRPAADMPAAVAPNPRPAPAAGAKKPGENVRTSDKPPEISELIRKLDNLQKLLRLD